MLGRDRLAASGWSRGMGMDEQEFTDGLPTGTVLREYVIEAAIGQGGYGVVYRARHRYLDRVVALKEYFPVMAAVRTEGTVRPRNRAVTADYEEGLRRFMEEARRLEQFRSHPGVVTCLGFFEERGTAYLAMEYEDGIPLSELLAKREAAASPLAEGELLGIAEQLLESLAAVHEAGVLHRDIKPSNILVRRSDERPVLIDFGAAKTDFAQHTKSLAPQTRGYAAIEQVEEEGELGPWTDLYGLGAVLWRIVAGGRRPQERLVPVDAPSRMLARLRDQDDPQPLARELGAGRFSSGVLDAIDKCLRLEPKERPATCQELLALLSVPVRLGDMYYWGEDVPQDRADAAEWYRKAAKEVGSARVSAEEGDPEAQSYLGYLYHRGEGVPKDDALAAGWYRKAAEQGDAEAQCELGTIYHRGRGVPQDDALAAEWWRKAAEQGHAVAQCELGTMYHRGNGLPKDDALAAGWWRKAAEQGDPEAQSWLGYMYYLGEGEPEDVVLAVGWFFKAAEEGEAEAQYRLGARYHRGEGVPKNDALAAEWYCKAAEQGNRAAQRVLGRMYLRGEGVPKDATLAARWLREAAKQGS